MLNVFLRRRSIYIYIFIVFLGPTRPIAKLLNSNNNNNNNNFV